MCIIYVDLDISSTSSSFLCERTEVLRGMKEEVNRYLIVRQKKEGIIFFVLK